MRKIFLTFTALLFGVPFVCAQSWQFVGPRAMGMGGAGVATAYGPDAQYWNPAGLAQEEDVNETGVLINAGVSLESTKNVLEAVSNLTDISKQYNKLVDDIDSNANISAQDINTIFTGLNDISKVVGKNTGALVNTDVGLGIKIKNFSISARSLGTASILPVVDTKNIQFNSGGAGVQVGHPSASLTPANQTTAEKLAAAIDAHDLFTSLKTLLNATTCSNSLQLATALIDAAASYGVSEEEIAKYIGGSISNMGGAAEIIKLAGSSTGSYKDNETVAMADAAAFGEVSLGYGMKVYKGVKVGANVKVISGYTAQNGILLLQDNEKVEDILDKAKDNKKNTTNLAVDLGTLVNFSQLLERDIFLNPQVGLTARNINGPKFDRPDLPAGTDPAIAANWRTDKYQLKPQLRAGAAINPAKWMTLAADLDITENDTLLKGIKSRQFALGAEFNLVNKPKFNIPLRIGYNTNLATSEMSPFYTAGIGFNMIHFFVEISGAVSNKTNKVDGKDIPSSAGASLAIGLLF